jgi:hypothetical protein
VNKLKYIFICIFLSGMIFTVINYLPLIEEEVSSKKIEVCKKVNPGESPEGFDNETEGDNEADNLFNNSLNFDWSSLFIKEHTYVNTFKDYFFLSEDRSTPPPKI